MAVSTINAVNRTEANYKAAYDQVTSLRRLNYYTEKSIIDSLNLQLDKKTFIPTNKFVFHFFSVLEERYKHNDGSRNTFYHCYNSRELVNLAHKMIDLYDLDLTPELISFMFRDHNWEPNVELLCNLYIKRNKKIPLTEIIEIFFKEQRYISGSDCDEDIKISKSTLRLSLDKAKWLANIDLDEKTIDCIFENNLRTMMLLLIKKKVQVKSKYLDYAIINNDKGIFDLLFSMIPSFTLEHLYLACQHSDCNIIKNILDQKIRPDEKCIERMFENVKQKQQDQKILSYAARQRRYGQTTTTTQLLSESEKLKRKVEMLINYGYNITKKDLLIITKGGVHLEDKYIQKDFFNDQIFKKEMTDECNKNLLYMYDIEPNKYGLIEHCRRKATVSDIREYIIKNKIQPDIECLKEACKHKNNLAVVKTLTEKYGVEPDFECLINCIGTVNGNNQLKYIAAKARKALLQESDDEKSDLDKLEAENIEEKDEEDEEEDDDDELENENENLNVNSKKKPNPKLKKTPKKQTNYDSSDESDEKPVTKAKKVLKRK